jgi:hypothetical protein
VRREWGRPVRPAVVTFAVAWSGITLSAAFPFALGAALALLALASLEARRTRWFAVLALLALAASPLAFALLGVVLVGVGLARGDPGPRAVPLVLGVALAVELVLHRVFPGSGRFPFSIPELIPALIFCGLGLVSTRGIVRARSLYGVFVVYLFACVASFLVPSEIGSNIERLRYAALPIALLVLALRDWRPLRLAVPAIVLAAVWNVTPLETSFARASSDPARERSYWQPAVHFLEPRLSPSYRVDVVDTVGHWGAEYLPAAGVPIARGWFRQSDFPANELLYDPLGRAGYGAWLRSLGVRYVVLADAPLDVSGVGEARLLRSGESGLVRVFTSPHLWIYRVPRARPIVTGPAPAAVTRLDAAGFRLRVARPGAYRVAIRWSPYWRARDDACLWRGHDGMLRLSVRRRGVVDVRFALNVRRGLEQLAGLGPSRACAP